MTLVISRIVMGLSGRSVPELRLKNTMTFPRMLLSTSSSPSLVSPTKKVHVANYLSKIGVCSRRKAEQYLAQKRITVNGSVLPFYDPRVGFDDRISIDDKPLPRKRIPVTLPADVSTTLRIIDKATKSATRLENFIPFPVKLWLFYKKRKLICSEHEQKRRNTVYQYLEKHYDNLMSKHRLLMVGRLDYNAEGLMLLTNCGELKRRLEHPSNYQQRVYHVCVDKLPSEKQLDLLNYEGLVHNTGIKVDPFSVSLTDEVDSTVQMLGGSHWLKVIPQRNRSQQFRLGLDHLGLQITRVIRVQFGPYVLPSDLNQGKIVRKDLLDLPLPVKSLKPPLDSNDSTLKLTKARHTSGNKREKRKSLSSEWI